MASTTTAAIKEQLATAYAGYMTELKQAGPNWETKPATGEGEDAWCARQVAEHIAGAATFFGAGIATGIGVDGPARGAAELANAETALETTERNHAALVAVLEQVRDDQLDTEVNAPQLGGMIPLERIMLILPSHLADHTNQLKTLRGG